MEEAHQFYHGDRRLFGILHKPDTGSSDVVVVMVTGGPQTRYGSHRLYVDLARYLCQRGIAAFRFDYEGLGDSDGEFIGYALAAPSIKAAMVHLDSVLTDKPKRLIWTLCDGVSASLMYNAECPKTLCGMILCNPLLHDDMDLYHRHYYLKQIHTLEFWKRVLSMDINLSRSIPDFLRTLRAYIGMKLRKDPFTQLLPEKMQSALLKGVFEAAIPIRFILSSDDVVAQEFQTAYLENSTMARVLETRDVGVLKINKADHTFTHPSTKQDLFEQTYSLILEIKNRMQPEDKRPQKTSHSLEPGVRQ
jgi:uncharacterized protein